MAGDLPTIQYRNWSEAQALTRAAPTLSTEGMSLVGVTGYTLMISANVGQTLSGAGNLRAYWWDWTEATPRWKRMPDLDRAVTLSGVRDMCFGDTQDHQPSGLLLYAADGVTVSGGTCTVSMVAKLGMR